MMMPRILFFAVFYCFCISFLSAAPKETTCIKQPLSSAGIVPVDCKYVVSATLPKKHTKQHHSRTVRLCKKIKRVSQAATGAIKSCCCCCFSTLPDKTNKELPQELKALPPTLKMTVEEPPPYSSHSSYTLPYLDFYQTNLDSLIKEARWKEAAEFANSIVYKLLNDVSTPSGYQQLQAFVQHFKSAFRKYQLCIHDNESLNKTLCQQLHDLRLSFHDMACNKGMPSLAADKLVRDLSPLLPAINSSHPNLFSQTACLLEVWSSQVEKFDPSCQPLRHFRCWLYYLPPDQWIDYEPTIFLKVMSRFDQLAENLTSCLPCPENSSAPPAYSDSGFLMRKFLQCSLGESQGQVFLHLIKAEAATTLETKTQYCAEAHRLEIHHPFPYLYYLRLLAKGSDYTTAADVYPHYLACKERLHKQQQTQRIKLYTALEKQKHYQSALQQIKQYCSLSSYPPSCPTPSEPVIRESAQGRSSSVVTIPATSIQPTHTIESSKAPKISRAEPGNSASEIPAHSEVTFEQLGIEIQLSMRDKTFTHSDGLKSLKAQLKRWEKQHTDTCQLQPDKAAALNHEAQIIINNWVRLYPATQWLEIMPCQLVSVLACASTAVEHPETSEGQETLRWLDTVLQAIANPATRIAFRELILAKACTDTQKQQLHLAQAVVAGASHPLPYIQQMNFYVRRNLLDTAQTLYNIYRLAICYQAELQPCTDKTPSQIRRQIEAPYAYMFKKLLRHANSQDAFYKPAVRATNPDYKMLGSELRESIENWPVEATRPALLTMLFQKTFTMLPALDDCLYGYGFSLICQYGQFQHDTCVKTFQQDHQLIPGTWVDMMLAFNKRRNTAVLPDLHCDLVSMLFRAGCINEGLTLLRQLQSACDDTYHTEDANFPVTLLFSCVDLAQRGFQLKIPTWQEMTRLTAVLQLNSSGHLYHSNALDDFRSDIASMEQSLRLAAGEQECHNPARAVFSQTIHFGHTLYQSLITSLKQTAKDGLYLGALPDDKTFRQLSTTIANTNDTMLTELRSALSRKDHLLATGIYMSMTESMAEEETGLSRDCIALQLLAYSNWIASGKTGFKRLGDISEARTMADKALRIEQAADDDDSDAVDDAIDFWNHISEIAILKCISAQYTTEAVTRFTAAQKIADKYSDSGRTQLKTHSRTPDQ